MRLSRHRWTVFAVAVWVLVLGLTTIFAPVPAEAKQLGGGHWFVYTPNHPNGCAPLPYDCYTIWIVPD
jgi:hypothetical protein